MSTADFLALRVVPVGLATMLLLLTACGGNVATPASVDSGSDGMTREAGGEASAGDAASDATAPIDGSVLFVLGEPDTKSNLPVAYGLNTPSGAFIVGTKLLVADAFGGRVLVWNALPTAAGVPPDFALGQPDLASDVPRNRDLPAPTASTLQAPSGIWSDGTRVFVADTDNNRVLVWNTFPTHSGQPADFALGQPAGAANLTSATPDNGGVSGASMSAPMDVWSDGTQLYVACFNDARVLVWSTMPTSPTPATFALGQPKLTSTKQGTGLGQMENPTSVQSVGTTLYVADQGRLLVWNAIPTATSDASLAIDGTGWTTPHQLAEDLHLAHAGSPFVLSDVAEQTVFVWNNNPTTANQSPDFVLGTGTGVSATTVGNPWAIATNGTRLYVADLGEARLLGWNALPTASYAPADFAVGQPAGPTNLTTSAPDDGFVSGATFAWPGATTSDGTRLFVADAANNRVLVWNAVPTSDVAADFALGQPSGAANLTSFGQNVGGVSGATLASPADAVSDGTRLFVADTSNNRVLVWNSIPASPTSADFALGQPAGASNLTSNDSGNNGNGIVDGSGMNSPTAVWTDGTRLFVVDSGNCRVLVWNRIPTEPVAADFALGQPDLTSRNNCDCSPTCQVSADSLTVPSSVDGDGTHLIVADQQANRVLIWNHIPTASVPADVVVGQPDFTSNQNGPSQTVLASPTWAHSDGTRLYVADSPNNRVLVWDSIPTSNGAPASRVIGQPDFTSWLPNQDLPLGATGLQYPSHVWTDHVHLFITDQNNDRTLVLSR